MQPTGTFRGKKVIQMTGIDSLYMNGLAYKSPRMNMQQNEDRIRDLNYIKGFKLEGKTQIFFYIKTVIYEK